MKIKTLSIKKFTVFKDAEFQFSPGINVIVGENGTGKSHLLKLLYATLKTNQTALGKSTLTGRETILPQKLIRIFRPDDDGLGRLVFRGQGRASAEIAMKTNSGEIDFQLTTPGNFKLKKDTLTSTPKAIFIPSRESFSIFEGFLAAYDARELSFDETYRDLCVALSATAPRGARAAEISALVEPFEKEVLNGSVRLRGGRFYVSSLDGDIEAHLLSEGQRKIASLVRLILNGSLTSNGFLFWDEPEANLNPRLVAKVAVILQSLAASGIQVFVATHDYLLTQELSLAAEHPKLRDPKLECDMKFFALSRSDDNGVTVQDGKIMAELSKNPILKEFAAHYDREQALFNREISTPKKQGN